MEDQAALKPLSARQNAQFFDINADCCSHYADLYRGTASIRNRLPVGPYSRAMPRAIWRSWGGALFLMIQVPLYEAFRTPHNVVGGLIKFHWALTNSNCAITDLADTRLQG